MPERVDAALAAPGGAIMRRAPTKASTAVRAVVLAAAILVLIAPAFWNGFPVLQYDTGGYLARWYEGYLVPSRPGAYGLVLAATVPLHFWPIVLLQSGLTVWVLVLVLRCLGCGGRPLVLLAIVSVLSLVTTLPWLTAILLTDIFAGLAVLALYLFVFRAELLARYERWGLIALVAFAAAAHSATLALVGALALAAALVWLVAASVVPRRGVQRALAAAALAIVMTLAANFAVAGKVMWTPGGYGILFGRMLEEGIVDRYLAEHCRETPFKLCPFRRQLPHDADTFLWASDIFDRLGRFAGLGEEMRTIVLGSLREYPVQQATAALRATARQLVHVASGEGVLTTMWHTYGIMERYTPSVVPAMRAARQQHGELSFSALNLVHVPTALFALAMLPLLVVAGWRWASLAQFGLLAATLVVAVLANAVICGALANPHDRYGARLVWLAPLVLMLVPIAIGFPRRNAASSALKRDAQSPAG
jgi:hypothetical protein